MDTCIACGHRITQDRPCPNSLRRDHLLFPPEPKPFYYCAICGEPVGSPYAKSCCIDDNMIEE